MTDRNYTLWAQGWADSDPARYRRLEQAFEDEVLDSDIRDRFGLSEAGLHALAQQLGFKYLHRDGSDIYRTRV